MAAITYRLADVECPFAPWRKEMGQVFTLPYALDVETTLINPERPWEATQYILGAACDGEKGFFLPADRVLEFMQTHHDVEVAFHNAPFDLKVLHRLAQTRNCPFDVYDLVEQNRVWDTMLLHRLYTLATEGRASAKKGKSSLEHCARLYLDCELPKDVKDANGNDVRLSYGRYLGGDLKEIDHVYLEYLAKDALATVLVFDELMERIMQVLETSITTWGCISKEWLEEQIRRWGPQTHHIQVKAAVVLDAVTANGIGLDLESRTVLTEEIHTLLAEKEASLAAQGYVSGKGSAKVLQNVVAQTLQEHPEIKAQRTAGGKYKTSEDALAELAGVNAFFRDLHDCKAAAKLLSTYLDKMGKERLHPRFDVLKNTGRTSSFGDVNAQNLPRDDRVRRCFVPEKGSLYLDADYSTIEMATLAQSVLRQFGGNSAMAEAINAGKDLHKLVAARVTNQPEADVSKDERSKAKPINFGKPGGMGAATLKEYASASYGISLSDDEVSELEDAWFELFPEMVDFLGDEQNLGWELADLLDLTPLEYNRASQHSPRSNDPDQQRPADWLGLMCLKVLASHEPKTRAGKRYTPEQVDYFWDKAQSLALVLKPSLCKDLQMREPSPELAKAVRNLVGKNGVFTLTGRLRANAGYCARHNTVFQGLAADGAKIALWRLWRAGYKLVNFIHDQVLIEVPETDDLPATAETVERIMVEGMREVVPDVAVKVEWAYRRRWSKKPEDEVLLAAEAAV